MEEGDDEIEETSFPPEVLKRILGLRKMQTDAEEVDAEYRAERMALEMKFHELRTPLADRRRDIINGLIEVPETETVPPTTEPSPEDAEIKGIPGFWLQTLGNHPVTGDLISEADAPALGALEDITISYEDDYTAFVLSFHFKENPYFSNSV